MTPDINNLPQLELLASFNSFDELSDIDLKSNIPVQPKFKYYTTQDFVNNEAIIINCTSSKCFSGLHTNIRSLNSNFDNFTQMLTELNHDGAKVQVTGHRLQVIGCRLQVAGHRLQVTGRRSQ